MFSTFNAMCSQGYQPSATDFDVSDSVSWGGLTGQTAYSSGTLMVWVRNEVLAMGFTLFRNGSFFSLSFPSPSSDLRATVTMNDGGANNFSFCNTTSLSATGVWRQILASWDSGFTVGNRLATMVVTGNVGTAIVNDSGTGSLTVPVPASSLLGYVGDASHGCISELYFAPGQYIDLTVASNRAKFITSGGEPVYLGQNGEAPTGIAPLIYLKNPSSTYNVNSGTGGNGTIGGTLTACSSVP